MCKQARPSEGLAVEDAGEGRKNKGREGKERKINKKNEK